MDGDDVEFFFDTISKYDNVSFDVFDTLLLRPYVLPTDLFKQIEIMEFRKGFAKARINAEKKARKRLFPEVTLEEIYSFMPPEFSEMAELELEYERQVLVENPEMKKLLNRAVELGKNVIYISDMYLPPKFIMDILEKNGYPIDIPLYVSNEYRMSKHDGSLFIKVLNDLSIPAHKLLHVGDNKISDDSTPKRLGINALRRDRPVDRYLKSNPRERRYYRSKKSLGRSIIVGINSIGWINGMHQGDFWTSFGFRYGGPILAGFSIFIDRNIPKDGILFFIARDGFGPWRAYNSLFGKNHNKYVYAPRIFGIIFGLNGRDYLGYEEQITEYFIKNGLMRYEEQHVMKSGSDEGGTIQNEMRKELERFSEYLKSKIPPSGEIYVVDATTMKFSSQNLIDAALPDRNVRGMYYNLIPGGKDSKNSSFRRRSRFKIGLSDVDLPEFLMSSSEPPITGIDSNGKPIFSEDVHELEQFKMQTMESVIRGEDMYLKLFKKVFGSKMPQIEEDALFRWMDSFARNMGEEEKGHMNNLKWASDPFHDKFHDIVFSPKDIFWFIGQKIHYGIKSIKHRK